MDDFINPIITWLLTTSLQGGLVVCLILILRRLFGNSLKSGWSYFLWGFVILRLVVPSGYEVKLPDTFGLLETTYASFYQHVTTPRALENLDDGAPLAKSRRSSAAIDSNKITVFSPWLIFQDKPLIVGKQLLFRCMFIIWLGGTLTFLYGFFQNNLRMTRQVSKSNACEDQEMLMTLAGCQKALGINKHILLKWDKYLSSPASFGIFHPVILLPESAKCLDKNQLSMILQHEIIHHKRHDLLTDHFMSLLKGINWFNPFIWLAHKMMRQDCELSCDRLVTHSFNHHQLFDYGELLIRYATQARVYGRRQINIKRNSVGVCSMSDQINHIKSRLRLLGQSPSNIYTAPLKTSLSFILTAVIGFTSPALSSVKVQAISFNSTLVEAFNTTAQLSGVSRYQPQDIAGLLTQPKTGDKYPAIVLLSGCDGLKQHHKEWADQLTREGYATLRIWRPKETSAFCDQSVAKINTRITAQVIDAYVALTYLSQQDFIDGQNISVMSWQSWAAIGAAAKYGIGQVYDQQFSSAIAMYPDCSATYNGDFRIPLQILVGERDDWAYAEDCLKIQKRAEQFDDSSFMLTYYSDAFYGFDNPSFKEETFLPDAKNLAHLPAKGAIGKFDQSVYSDAQEKVSLFLERHLVW